LEDEADDSEAEDGLCGRFDVTTALEEED